MSKSTKFWITIGLLVAFLFSLIFLAYVAFNTAVPNVMRGTPVTNMGWGMLWTAFLGSGSLGLTSILSAIWTWVSKNRDLLHNYIPNVPLPSDETAAEMAELASAFADFMHDKTNRASQRRMVFALADCAKLIKGVDTANENGVIVIRYSGYADPVTATK